MIKGKFITIYGVNNIGKTTHSKLLVSRMQQLGYDAVYLKYPIYDMDPTGPFINKVLRSSKNQTMPEEELQLWFVLNRYQFQPQLMEFLNEGKIVVAEDYIGTGVAWGTAKGARQNDLEEMNKFLVQPHLNILLEGARSLKAREKSHIHETNDLLASKCQKVLVSLAKKHHWKVVNIDKDKTVTAEKVWNAASEILTPFRTNQTH